LRPRNPNVMDISGQPVTDPVVLGNLPKWNQLNRQLRF
jgi:hypothetical protein